MLSSKGARVFEIRLPHFANRSKATVRAEKLQIVSRTMTFLLFSPSYSSFRNKGAKYHRHPAFAQRNMATPCAFQSFGNRGEKQPGVTLHDGSLNHMNTGGFSWKRFLGVSAFKSRLSRKTGIPLTKSGRERKVGGALGALVPIGLLLMVGARLFRALRRR
jgi:hypothetical protein